jgi:hypothetical protein
MSLYIDENNIFDYSTDGFDRFLRKSNSPFLKDYSFTEKGGKYGLEIISKNTSIMPRVITRSRLDEDALVNDVVLSERADILIQASSGFKKPFTDFLFLVQWDGTNYHIRRFNKVDYETYVQDGFATNTGLPATPNAIWGIAVQPDYVFIAWRDTANVNKVSKFGYNLSHIETKTPPTDLTTMICADDVFIYGLATAPNRILKYDFTNNTITSINWNIGDPFPQNLFLFDGEFFYGFDATNNSIVVFKVDTSNNIAIIKRYGIIEQVKGVLNTDNILRAVIKGASHIIIKPLKI